MDFSRAIRVVLFALILLVISIMVTLQIPRVQTALADKAVEFLQENFDAKISLDRIHLKPFNTVVLKRLTVVDKEPFSPQERDTLFHVEKLSVRFSLRSLIGPGHENIILKEVKIAGGQFNLVIDSTKYGNNLCRCFKLLPKKDTTSSPSEKDVFSIKNIKMSGFAFSMRNLNSPIRDFPETAINWSDLDIKNIEIDAHDFDLSHGIYAARLDHLSLEEKSGWKLRHLSGNTITGRGKVIINNIRLQDDWTDADLDFSMTGKSRDYADFLNKVRLDVDMRECKWSMATLSHFIPPMTNPSTSERFIVSGRARGPVSHLYASGLRVELEKSQTGVSVYGEVMNLPDMDAFALDVHLRGLSFRFKDAGRVMRAVWAKSELDLSSLGTDMKYMGYIDAEGNINDLLVKAMIRQQDIKAHGAAKESGEIRLDLRTSNILKNGEPPIGCTGHLNTTGLDVGKILASKTFGQVSATASFKGKLPGGNGSPLEAEIDTLLIHSAHVNGYTYHSISGHAGIYSDNLTGMLKIKDPSLDANLTIGTDGGYYTGEFKVNVADLKAMNIDKREVGLAQFRGSGRLEKDLRAIRGIASLRGITMTNTSGAHHVPDMEFVAGSDGSTQSYTLRSKLADIDFKGKNGAYTAGVGVQDMRELLAYVLPGLYLEKGSKIDAQIDSAGIIRGHIQSGRVAFWESFARNMTADISGTADSLHADILAGSITALGNVMDSARISADWVGESIRACCSFDNGDAGDNNLIRARVSADMTLGKENTSISIDPSFLSTKTNLWNIDSSTVIITPGGLTVRDFRVSSRDQLLCVDGQTSSTDSTIIVAKMDNFDISILNTLMGEKSIGLKGKVTADAHLRSPIGEGHLPAIGMKLRADSLALGGIPLGTLYAGSAVSEESDRFKVKMTDEIDGRDAIHMEADYSPSEKTVGLSARFEGFPLGSAKGLLKDVFSDISGGISGSVKANGPIKQLDLSSDSLRIDGGMIRVAFTDVPYYIDGGFSLDNNGIHIGDMSVKDRLDGKGKVSGGVSWNRFSDMKLGLGLDVKNIEAINIKNRGNALFWGNIFASGKVFLNGPFSSITLSGSCATMQNSKLHVSLSNAEQNSKKQLLNFVNPYYTPDEVDPYQLLIEKYIKKDKKTSTGFSIDIAAMADPSLSIIVDLGNEGFAAGLSGRGNGAIRLKVDPSSERSFEMLGDYSLSEGKFNVNAAGLVHRAFNIKNGSSIKFTGDILRSSVDINATYQTKASIASLIADTTSVSSRRPVNCGIKVQNTLSSPLVQFSIDIPDLEPTIKASVESALSTEDKVQKQFLSLLLSGNFIPDEQNGVVNNTSLLYANVSEMMAGQINNIFSKLDIPLDLGLNYQPTDRGANIFDVALSTQLFNNRVVIGGSVGNRQNTNSVGQSIVGDLDVEVKMDRRGSLRLKLFSHSADQYTQFLDNSQRNGIGMSWQQDFDNFLSWCNRLFMSKKKKMQIMDEEFRKSKDKVTISVDE